MAVDPLLARLPTGPLVDAGGSITPAWRAFLTALAFRTGGTVGLATPDIATVEAGLASETAAREAGDVSLATGISNEAAARSAVDATKYAIAGGTIGGPIGFYGHGAGPQPVVTGAKAGNAALASLLTGLAGLGLVNDAST